jgi:hypothetical protein
MPPELDRPQLDRSVSIPTTRLRPWVERFRRRHGHTEVSAEGDAVRLAAADGAVAEVVAPFPPQSGAEDQGHDGDPLSHGEHRTTNEEAPLVALLRQVETERRIGAILVRKGGFAVGVFDGPRLLVSKVGSAYVQGKTKAGGWSQQRYARRRDNQSRKAYADAADTAVRVLLPHLQDLAAVATGGDKPAIAAVLADPRLEGLRPLVLPQVHAVPDPRLRVLEAFPEQFLTVEIRLNELA